MRRTTPISIEVGKQELQIAVTYRLIKGQSPSRTDPGHSASIEIDDAVFLLPDNQRPTVPDCILWALQADANEGGPIWDWLMEDVRRDFEEV
jgi:hypothetical protein